MPSTAIEPGFHNSLAIPQVVDAIKKGAFDYLAKPINAKELLIAIERAIEASELQGELSQRRTLQLVSNRAVRLIGTSKEVENLRLEIAKVGPSDTTLLIEGETGTGKEVLAREMHSASTRAEKSFVALNCGAISNELMESELFGHKRGAITGAQKDSPGKFRLAHRGTLLLDEVGELSSAAQVKLLRALEEFNAIAIGVWYTDFGARPAVLDGCKICSSGESGQSAGASGAIQRRNRRQSTSKSFVRPV